MWKLCWCPLKVGWPSADQGSVLFEGDIRIIRAFSVPGIMLNALYLIALLIFATAL